MKKMVIFNLYILLIIFNEKHLIFDVDAKTAILQDYLSGEISL